MRGKPILEKTDKTSEAKSSSETEGLEWSYAMRWSNDWMDVFAALVPGVLGGSSGEQVGPKSESYKILRNGGGRQLANGKYQAPLYWGNLPFTSGPVYFGAGIIFLFILGLWLLRGQLKWGVAISVLLIVLLSLGKNLEWFQRLFFEYFPMYNKFRAHNSAMSVAAFLVPLLGFITLSKIFDWRFDKKEIIRGLMVAGGITGAICLFFALLGPSFFDFTSEADARYQEGVTDIFIKDRKAWMSGDGWRSLFIILLTGGLIWAYVQEKISKWVFLGLLGLVTIGDLWGVGRRYLNTTSFETPKSHDRHFQPRPVDQQILQLESDRSKYRVFDLSINTFNSNSTSYHHNTIGGYHPAKLQRIQDVIDHHIGKGNQAVLNMLNTKYVITQEGKLQQNPGALGNAWFVENITKVNTANEEIDALKNFDSANDAVVLDTEFDNYISDFYPQKNGTITLTNYELDRWTYTTNATSEQLAVFSEIWYGGDKNWKVTIDGEPAKHIRANYCLRALRVPAGQHTIEFRYEPPSYYAGEKVALISSLLILALLGFVGYKGFQNIDFSKQEEPVMKKSVRVKKTVKKKKVGKKKSKKK